LNFEIRSTALVYLLKYLNIEIAQAFGILFKYLFLSICYNNAGHVLVADYANHRVLLLDRQLCLERVLVDSNSQVKMWRPRQLHLNERTSQLYVVHQGHEHLWWRTVITQWTLR